MMADDDWCFRLGVEDASYGIPAGNPAAPITPELRERYLAGYNSHEARVAANRNLVAREKERQARAAARWQQQLNPDQKVKRKRGKHEHGKDW